MKLFSKMIALCAAAAMVVTMSLGASAATLYGDANQDGTVNAGDLTALARHVGGIQYLTGTGLQVCCLSGTNTAGASDLTKMARYVAHISTILAPEDDGTRLTLVDTDPDQNGSMVIDYDDLLNG